jgi:predicted secreted Zn-dependent protease
MNILFVVGAGMAGLAQPAYPAPTSPALQSANAPGPALVGVPNIEVTYYQVTGKDVPEIHRSLAKAAPRDGETGRRLPATSSWSMSAGAKWTRTGQRCELTAVDLRFAAKASLPRLLVTEETPPAVLALWNDYVARLEARQAAQLRFAYDRQSSVEQAIRRSGCYGWEAAATAAIARIRDQQLLAFKNEVRNPPKLLEPKGEREDQKRSATSSDTIL